MTGIATAFGAEPTVSDAQPKRTNRICEECGKGRHVAGSTCSKVGAPKERPARVMGDVSPRRTPLKPQKVAQDLGVCIVLIQGAILSARPDWAEDQLTPDELGQLSYALT